MKTKQKPKAATKQRGGQKGNQNAAKEVTMDEVIRFQATAEFKEKLNALAEARGISVAELIRKEITPLFQKKPCQ